MTVINLIVEGEIDEVIAHKIVGGLGHQIGVSYGKKGAGYIKNKIQDFNKSAQNICYLALVDFMDTKCSCPPEVISTWLPYKNNLMIFRIVVREVESWILADRENLSKFLNISIELITEKPEEEQNPKQTLVNLARKSHSAKMRSALVPEQGSTAQVGKLYNSELKRFVNEYWKAENARQNSPSLSKCLTRLGEI